MPLTPHKNGKSGHNSPENELYSQRLADQRRAKEQRTYPIVDIGSSIHNFGPEESLAKGIAHGFALPKLRVNFLVEVGHLMGCTHSFSRTVSAVVFNCLRNEASSEIAFPHNQRIMWHYTFVRGCHFGSHGTYPLLIPLTSRTTSSKPSKSSIVIASNPTSNKIRDHSKKAYRV